jgi:hypothetical protein
MPTAGAHIYHPKSIVLICRAMMMAERRAMVHQPGHSPDHSPRPFDSNTRAPQGLPGVAKAVLGETVPVAL